MNGSSGNPGPVSIHTLHYLGLYQIKTQDHFRYPQSVTEADLETADRVIALSQSEHEDMIRTKHPGHAHLVHYMQIEDIHIHKPAYAIPRLVHSLDQLMRELQAAEI